MYSLHVWIKFLTGKNAFCQLFRFCSIKNTFRSDICINSDLHKRVETWVVLDILAIFIFNRTDNWRICLYRESCFNFFNSSGKFAACIYGLDNLSSSRYTIILIIEKTLSYDEYKPLTMSPYGFMGRCLLALIFAYSKWKTGSCTW